MKTISEKIDFIKLLDLVYVSAVLSYVLSIVDTEFRL